VEFPGAGRMRAREGMGFLKVQKIQVKIEPIINT
jgi:hypothetical protein